VIEEMTRLYRATTAKILSTLKSTRAKRRQHHERLCCQKYLHAYKGDALCEWLYEHHAPNMSQGAWCACVLEFQQCDPWQQNGDQIKIDRSRVAESCRKDGVDSHE
jgi:hypothetical protein